MFCLCSVSSRHPATSVLQRILPQVSSTFLESLRFGLSRPIQILRVSFTEDVRFMHRLLQVSELRRDRSGDWTRNHPRIR